MPPKKRKLTRGQASETLFGGGLAELSETTIPTYRDIAKFYHYLQSITENEDIGNLAECISEKVVHVWGKVSDRLPLIQAISIENKIKRYLVFLKSFKQKRVTKKVIGNNTEKLDKIFDICSCTCNLEEVNCDHKFIKCKVENCKQTHLLCACDPKVNLFRLFFFMGGGGLVLVN